jgi:hypothetical protein
MELVKALMNVQYDRNWEIWAKSTSSRAKSQYTQASNNNTILADQGWQYITNGEEIGDYIAQYCEGIPAEDRPDFAEEAVEQFLGTL